MKRFLLSFMILGVMAGSVGTADANEESTRVQRTVEGSYAAPFMYFVSWCAPSDGMGCVSVATRETETSLTAKATDAHGQPVSVRVSGYRENDVLGDEIDFGTFCGQTSEPISFHPGVKLEFWVGVPDANCLPGTATTGTISVTLSGRPADAPAPTPSPAPTPTPSPAPSPAPEPEISSLTLEGPKSVSAGKKAKLTATARPCPGHQGERVDLYRGKQKIASAASSVTCTATFTVKITRTSTFRAISPAGTSNKLTIRAR